MRIGIQQTIILLLVLLTFLVSCDKITTDPQEQCATPILTPAGGIYTESQSVSITCSTAGASIRYTIDGTNPTSSSTIYTNPINLTETRTIKAIAYKEGWTDSQVAVSSYAIQIPVVQTVADPVFNPPEGSYASSQNVSISCATQGATIRYTVDGSNPDSLSAIYANPMIVTANSTIKARSFKPGWISSQVVTASYAIELLTVATPVFAPSGGNYISGIAVSIKCATPGATIRFTSDGSNPNASSPLYTGVYNVTVSTTLKAKAFKTELLDSKTATAAYAIQAAKPMITPPGGIYNTIQNVTISCTTSGATIRYTTNGSNPTVSSTVYAAPIYVPTSVTIKAIAFKTGLSDSQTAQANYQINIPVPSTFVLIQGGMFNNGTSNVTLSSFYLSKYEVVQREYVSVMETNPSSGDGVGDTFPVYNVDWYNAIEYCNRRSIQEELSPCYSYASYGTNPDNWPAGWNTYDSNHTNITCNWVAHGYRLPTEMEWLYAARGGNETPNYTYSGSNNIDEVGWYYYNSDLISHVVGTKAPNALGLYDMTGNVWEWNWDIYGTYPSSGQENPHGQTNGTYRIARGGAWQANLNQCAVTYRSYGPPTRLGNFFGFRLCRNVTR